jgi:hypothetical protein
MAPMDDDDVVNLRIPKQHLPEFTGLIRNHIGEVRSTEMKNWLQNTALTNLEGKGTGGGTDFAGSKQR